jgi:penicillin-binding protein 2
MYSLNTSKSQTWLPWFLRGVLILGFVLLLARLFELQIIKGAYFRSLSEGNRIRRVALPAPRGKILARGGEVLVDNTKLEKRIVFDTEGYKLEAYSTGIKDEEKVEDWTRTYPLGESLAHLSGYLGEVNSEEAKKVDPKCIEKGPRKTGQLVGRGGLEEWYDCTLAGIPGEQLVEVDTSGKKIRLLGKKDPVAGKDIKTTIDFSLQKKVAAVMEGKVGAVVVTDPRGEVLALYSSPSFDPNVFTNVNNGNLKDNQEKISKIINDSGLPLFNRVISGLYHPGSVFKQVVSIAALQEGVIDKDFLYNDTGQIVLETKYGTYSYNNWFFTSSGGREGEINLVRAITRSTDTFFYKVGEMLGIDLLVSWSEKYGLDKKTGIDLPGEAEGLLPSPEWKEKVKGEKWFIGNTYHVSIGQGDLAITPLRVNMITAVTASGGFLCTPFLVGQTRCSDLGIKKTNLDLVKEGMRGACSSGGTGYTFFDADPKVGCKTGAAETVEKDVTHAWFTFFAPIDTPEIVVTVLVEKGGEGSKVAGPLAREIYDYWFTERIP